MTSLPPAPPARPQRVASPYGSQRLDPYYWLRDDERKNPEVIGLLAAETRHCDAVLEPVKPLMDELYQEIVGRLKQDDSSVPVRHRGYWYVVRYETGRQYPVVVRWPDGRPAEEQLLLDCNVLALGHPFFQLGGYEVSQDNRLIAYTEDTVGRRQFRLRVKEIAGGALLPDAVENLEPDVAWADDNRTVLYVEKDPVTLLGRRVRAHMLGGSDERLIYEEPDERFSLAVMRSKSDEYLYIGSESTTSSEWRYARADDPCLQFHLFSAREPDHEYQIEHLGEHFYMRTNRDALNFRIVKTPLGAAGERSRWVDVAPHDADVFIQSFDLFDTFLAVSERSGGLAKIRVQRWGEAPFHLIADDPAYTMRLGANPEIESKKLRFVYSSLTTPGTTYEQTIATGERVLLKREPVLGDFDPAYYRSEFVWAPARDGERIPVSIVYRKDLVLDGRAPLYQYAYGSYGLSTDPTFSSSRLSLLDRGFVYAIAHVRGGQELGRRWYDAGRLKQKWNTFYDFIDVTDFLVAEGYCARDKVFPAGGSAGGLLMGVIMNVAPEKYAGVVAHVPFVDVVTTMLDDTIPLTTLEYEEWGNPRERDYYEYMLSYSPYDNVRRQAYPPLLATTRLWDSQVQYYEPAKWVARLRPLNTSSSPILLHVNLEAGHGGKSGRFERLFEVAREYGFVLGLAQGRLRSSLEAERSAS